MKAGLGLGGALIAVAAATVLSIGLAHAQTGTDDAAGREFFERGRAAFDTADYERALVYFRHAYRLSHRGELQYNIGIAADLLQREEEALEAFQRYLEETDPPTREAEVRERIAALQRTIEERRATELALREATIEYRATNETKTDGSGLPRATIAGASALAAIGVAGVAAMSVGLAKDGSCKTAVGSQCVVEHSATAWTWVYGGLGAAALAGSAAWFAVSAKRVKNGRETRFSLTPSGVVVSGSF